MIDGLVVSVVITGTIIFFYEQYFKRRAKVIRDMFKAVQLYDMEMYRAAIRECEGILKKDSKMGFLYEVIGDSLSGLGEKEEAMVAYKKAIAIEKDSETAHIGIGKILLEQSKIEEAIDNFKKAIAVNAKHPIAKYYLALAYEMQGSDDLATKEIVEILEDNPEVEAIRDKLHEIYVRLGRLKEAESIRRWREPKLIKK